MPVVVIPGLSPGVSGTPVKPLLTPGASPG